MAIKKIVSKDNTVKWQVRVYLNGRGSTRLKRVFDKKIDAEIFLKECHKLQIEAAGAPVTVKKLNERVFKEEADYWLEFAKVEHSAGHLKRMKSVY